MGITNKGRKWEFLHSLWLIWIFTIFLNYVAFLSIGVRTRKARWIVPGFLYMAFSTAPFISSIFQYTGTAYEDILMSTFFIGWFCSIIHAFLARPNYLIMLSKMEDEQNGVSFFPQQPVQNPWQNDIPSQDVSGGAMYSNGNPVVSQSSMPYSIQPPMVPPAYPYPTTAFPQPDADSNPYMPYPSFQRAEGVYQQAAIPVPAAPPVQYPVPTPATGLLDLNSATEQQLAGLPGVSVAMAKKAIMIRAHSGGFASADEFSRQLGLMPHFAIQIESLACASPPDRQPVPSRRDAGRVIDI